MIDDLSKTLQAILCATVGDVAEVAFDRPADSYSPSARTVNLFLYDIRENAELRDNEPVVTRQNGTATITRPPLRLSCSYLVSVWDETGKTPEESILLQHRLLGEVLRVFSGMTVIEEQYLQGELKTSLYPVSLVTAQPDMVRNPSEFWTAIGGKLRPSFSVTAHLSMDMNLAPVEEYLVSSSQMTLGEKLPDESKFKDKDHAEILYEIGGVITDTITGRAIEHVELMTSDSGKRTVTDNSGRYRFNGLQAGIHSLRIVKEGYLTINDYNLTVPGSLPTAFDIKLQKK